MQSSTCASIYASNCSSIYTGELMHHRFRPKKHRFSYRVASWLLDLDEIDELDNRLTLFSSNRFNLVSFCQRDHGDGSDRPLREQINQLLQHHNIETPDKVTLLCYPRMLGYTFNPLAVYFCYRECYRECYRQCYRECYQECYPDKQLTAIVYEVSNTFGERHAYVAAVEPETRSGNNLPLEHKKKVIQQQADKSLHVSPFFPMDCYYHFRIQPPEERVTLSINLHNTSGKLFTAVFTGQRQSITDRLIVKQTLLLPLQTLKVIAAIHWEALRLWLKGISIYPHKPANVYFSHSRAHMSAATMPTAKGKHVESPSPMKSEEVKCFSRKSSVNREKKI